MKLTRDERRALNQRTAVLERIGDYILSGPSALHPPSDSRAARQWLESFLALQKSALQKGPLEVRQVYNLPNVWKGASGHVPMYPVIRRILWNRSIDIETAKKRVVDQLDLTAELFQMRQTAFEELERLSIQLDHALPAFPFQAEGISLELPAALQQESNPPEMSSEHEPKDVHSLVLRRGTSSNILEMSFSSGMSSEFDQAFFTMWRFLGKICVPEHRLGHEWTESWFMPPDEYAKLLNSTLGAEA